LQDPLVSVVVPVYDGEQFLAAAIESALAQDYPRQEIVVVDDGSTDASAEIAAAYPVTLLRQANAGVAGARNAGVAASHGELIAFLDQDDLWHEHKVSRQVAVLAARPSVGFALTQMEIVLEPGVPRPEWLDESMLDRPMGAPIPSALMVRRETFEVVGGFDPAYRITCDTDWLARAKDAGVESVEVDEPLLRYRIHTRNGAHERDALFRELKLALHASVRRQRAAAGAERA
jgi:glycosyltransferase involved in cell wall biosynthesis